MVLELIITAAIFGGAAGAAIIEVRKWGRNETRRREGADRRRDAEIAGLKSAVNGMMGLMGKMIRLHEASEQRRAEDRKAADQRHAEDRKAADQRHEAQQKAEARLGADMAEFKARLDALFQMHMDGMEIQRTAIAALAGKLAGLGKKVDALGEKADGMDKRLSSLGAQFAAFRDAVLPHAPPSGGRPAGVTPS